MKIKKSIFIKSSARVSECPANNLPEFAFIGRSNVGKSSLINLITDRKNLARISHTPGKTQLINHFLIDDRWYLVDLPGYGYAKVSKKDRKKFGLLIKKYFEIRENITCVFVLIDSSIQPQQSDLEFIDWLGIQGVPFVLVFTKTDKVNQKTRNKNLSIFHTEMNKTWEKIPPVFLSSSTKNTGKQELLEFIGQYI